MFQFEFDSALWFGIKLAWIKLLGVRLCLAQAHRRDMRGGSFSEGFGLMQINRRHLIYVGKTRRSEADVFRRHVCLGFFWLVDDAP